MAKDNKHSIPTVAPLFIDITGEDIDGDKEIDDLIARTLVEPLKDALVVHGLPFIPQQEQPPPSALSPAFTPPQIHATDTGRQRRSNQDDGPPRKRSRPEPEADELSNAQHCNGTNVEAKTIDDSQEKTEVEETVLKNSKSMAPAEIEASLASKEDELAAQIGPLHLQLIYHIHKSGVRDCRLCQ